MVLVPVAINYDRVLEDTVLIAADQRGDRRFGARITVVLRFVLRKLCQRLTRQGNPVWYGGGGLWCADVAAGGGPDASIEQISEDLMGRISQTMPVLSVPVVAYALLEQTDGYSPDALKARVGALLEMVPQANRVIKADAIEFELGRAIAGLVARQIIEMRDWKMAHGRGAGTDLAILCQLHSAFFAPRMLRLHRNFLHPLGHKVSKRDVERLHCFALANIPWASDLILHRGKTQETQRIDPADRRPIMALDTSIAQYDAPEKDLYEMGEMPPMGHVPKQMYAWAIRRERHGDPDSAMLQEVVDVPQLDSHDVLVLVMAAGINYNGVWAARGVPISPFDGHKQPYHIAGSDASGIVWAVG